MIKQTVELLKDAQDVLIRAHQELADDSPLRTKVAIVYLDILQHQIDEQLRQGYADKLTSDLQQ